VHASRRITQGSSEFEFCALRYATRELHPYDSARGGPAVRGIAESGREKNRRIGDSIADSTATVTRILSRYTSGSRVSKIKPDKCDSVLGIVFVIVKCYCTLTPYDDEKAG